MRVAACPCARGQLAESEPRRPILIISPSWSGLVGSPTKVASSARLSHAHSNSLIVPLIAGPFVAGDRKEIIRQGAMLKTEGDRGGSRHAAFISTAPAVQRPSAISAAKADGSRTSLPAGTTSVWPATSDAVRCGRAWHRGFRCRACRFARRHPADFETERQQHAGQGSRRRLRRRDGRHG